MPPAVGLPSNPRARTSPFPPPASVGAGTRTGSLPRNPGEHRSNRSISSPQTRLPARQVQEPQPPRQARSPQPPQRSRDNDTYGQDYAPRRSRDSDSSSGSSSGSSIWAREAASQHSSRTTLQSYDGDSSYKEVGPATASKHPNNDVSTFNVDTGHVWSRVTEAASVITGVGKVLASGLASYGAADEEELDDHLTNVLRAYHLAKARSPSELPEWLFSERERRLPGFQQSESHYSSQGQGDQLAQKAETRYPQDIYRTQDSVRPNEHPQEPSYRRLPPISQTRPLGDRLRDIRRTPGASPFQSRR